MPIPSQRRTEAKSGTHVGAVVLLVIGVVVGIAACGVCGNVMGWN